MNTIIYIAIQGAFLRITQRGEEKQWGAKDVTWEKSANGGITFLSMSTGKMLFNTLDFALASFRLLDEDPLYEEIGETFADYNQFKSWADRSLGFNTATGGSVAFLTQEEYDALEQSAKYKFDANNGIVTNTAFNKNFGFEEDTVLEGNAPAGKITNNNIYDWNYTALAYGVEWDTELPTTAMTRIGSINSHRTLPVQSLMRRCLLLDNGTVNYYLSATDSTKKEDGITNAVLDGTDGMVMVEIPEHYKKFETQGTRQRVLISNGEILGFTKVPKSYVSAYEASLQQSTSKLASVVNTTADYRGGNNNSAWDDADNTLLGKPATNISRINFRNYARNRGSMNWNMELSDTYKTWADLIYIEFANLNSQESYNPATTAQGYKQGGLGSGVTDANTGNWEDFNSYNPFIPCGTTNALGNNTGVVDYAPTGWADGKVFSVPSYRGIENPFGHIWKWMDGINLRIQSDADGGKSEVYVANTFNMNDTDYNGYTKVGEAARSSGYISRMIPNQLIPEDTSGASSNTFWADAFYAPLPNSGESLRGLRSGGVADSGADAGLACSRSISVPSYTRAGWGSRLIFLTEEMI